MKHHHISVKAILFVCLLSLTVFSQPDSIAVKYPYLSVTPEKPFPEDEVRLRILLGEASNSCVAPRFTNVSFFVRAQDLTIVPKWILYVLFTEETDSGKVCAMIYDPVDYGPVFSIGKLDSGTYRVINADSKIEYGSFRVHYSENVTDDYTIKGTVYDDPSPLKRASMPVEGAMVYLRPRYPVIRADSSSNRIMAPVTTDSAKTDARGVFSFTDVKRAPYIVNIVHKEYNSLTEELTLSSDTVLNYIMTPVDASASIHGSIRTYSWESAAAKPVPGCTVTVSPSRIDPAASPGELIAVPRLQAVTGEDGSYRIKNIPIDYNGQLWYVNVKKGELQSRRSVTLSNLADVEVSFAIMIPYGNAYSKTVNGIEYKIMTDRRRYLNRETVKIRYSIANTRDTAVTFGPFGGGCEYDLVVSTIGSAVEKEVFRASDHSVCLTMESFITVPAGETVVHTFPEYVLPDLKAYHNETVDMDSGATVPIADIVRVRVTGRLRSKAYDSSAVTVGIEVEIDTLPVAVEKRSVKVTGNSVRYNRYGNLLYLNLSEAQNITVKIYSLNGAVFFNQALEKHFTTGSHTISLRDIARGSGMFIIRVHGETFEKNIRAVKITR